MQIGNLEIEVIRKDIKNLYLKVYPPHGRVRVISPNSLENSKIKEFVIAKKSWIEQKQDKYKDFTPIPTKQYISGEVHYYRGDRLTLNVIYHRASAKVVVRENKYLDLYVKYGSILEQRERALTEWYRQQLKAELPGLIKKWEQVIGVKTNDWGVKKMKTRWGTCNTQAKRIWLNLELIKKPHQCLEYVVVHELVHLLERNHGDRFQAYMTRFMPRWREYERQLLSEGDRLR
ncbi:MAG: SprT family zinc-dependent metalloprotease [Cyanobacteria bacterium P01_G01_bin.19]